MPGLGKTTLAEKVYTDQSVSRHFQVRAWTVVSQKVDKRRVFLDLLAQIDPSKCSEATSSSDATTQDLAEKLWRSLKGKRYLIVLDDVWDVAAWLSLEESFPNDSKGSRIIMTSRHHDVASLGMLDESPHELKPLNKDESLDLIQRQLFGGNGWPAELVDLGTQIYVISGGLPLILVIVTGILKSIMPGNWKKVLDDINPGKLQEHCMETLDLSYRHLPDHLKPCLLYFAAFQEDENVSVKSLLQLWMAEGFVREFGMKRPADVAEEYLNDLINRSLVIPTQRKSIGGVKTCRIHDLVHEFCLQKSKSEQFFHFLEGGNDALLAFNEPRYLRRLCIHSNTEQFVEAKVYCSHVRSLRFKNFDEEWFFGDASFIMRISKFLRVLDTEQVCLYWKIPSEIGLLVQLTYLAIACSSIPQSIGNLSNLETVILNPYSFQCILLPNSFWNLQKLKHFYIRSKNSAFRVILPQEKLDSSSDLFGLDKISGLYISPECMDGVMKKLPNIRRLKFRIPDEYGTGNVEIVVPNFLSKLESLHIRVDDLPSAMFEFTLPENLRKLTLVRFNLSKRCLSSLGTLANLEVLKLEGVHFEGNTWKLKEGGFSKLRILKLRSRNLRLWSSPDEDQLVSLEKLHLYDCSNLEEMPSCLQSIAMLQIIEVIYCPRSVVELVENIEEAQIDYGNLDLKIITRRSC
ncbi:OLC1v1013838C1 [Oldenlandia corymbosa var. corymbosa]|uniref:OLC1v1013838C1 n=1 Tax=Oldenlandia corymbosa var. corymbosa TaxID=529605 RepID=A0AAV1DZD5_OLDCO|nr:OLC1v1013838C1 [Oldenlandia corymbosa var. corymbosa]